MIDLSVYTKMITACGSSVIHDLCSIDAHHPHPLISHYHLIRDFNPAVGEVAVPAGWIEQKREGRKLSEVSERREIETVDSLALL